MFVFGRNPGLHSLIVYILVFSVFMPYYITGAALVCVFTVVCMKKECRSKLFERPTLLFLLPFYVICFGSSIYYGNIPGIFCSLGIVMITSLYVYMSRIMTRQIYERALDLALMLSASISMYASLEMLYYIMILKRNSYRSQAAFFNANYFAAICVFCVIIAVYKLFSHSRYKLFYLFIIFLNFANMFISGSMLSWAAMAAGLFMLLFILKRYKLLVSGLFLFAVLVVIVSMVPELMPRLIQAQYTGSMRLIIWQTSLLQIVKTPFFGNGPLTYMLICKNIPTFQSQHAHNLVIESLLSYGVFGSVCLLGYVVKYFSDVINQFMDGGKTRHLALILSISSAILAWGLTDVIIFWIQTGLLVAFILSGASLKENTPQTEEA